MITVLGQPADLNQYRDRPGYNVYTGDWTLELVRAWIVERVAAGDEFKCVSTDFTGNYMLEIRWLQAEERLLRTQGGELIAWAGELGNAVTEVSKRWQAEQRGQTLDQHEEKG